MENLEIYNKYRDVPATAKKEIKGGRMNGKTDINPMWRIKALTELFGPCGIGWYYKPSNKWLEPCGDEIAAFVDIELFVKIGGEWSFPISGTGGSMFAAKERSGVYVSDECYKMATTDAISVACKQLGIGADVYWQADRTKYDNVDHNVDSKSNKSSTQPEDPKLTEEQMIAEQERIAKQKIGQAKVIVIKKELERTGVSEKAICSRYKVSTLGDITEELFPRVVNALQKTKSKEVA
jgi:hypothetical protein